jgi:hypothetical protein
MASGLYGNGACTVTRGAAAPGGLPEASLLPTAHTQPSTAATSTSKASSGNRQGTLDQCDAHLIAEFPQGLAGLVERAKDCFLPLLRYDDDVVSAIPPDMAWVLPVSHCGFSFVWPWRIHTARNHIPLHESTPERQSLFESHRQGRWLTHWSYFRSGDSPQVAYFVRNARLRLSGCDRPRFPAVSPADSCGPEEGPS